MCGQRAADWGLQERLLPPESLRALQAPALGLWAAGRAVKCATGAVHAVGLERRRAVDRGFHSRLWPKGARHAALPALPALPAPTAPPPRKVWSGPPCQCRIVFVFTTLLKAPLLLCAEPNGSRAGARRLTPGAGHFDVRPPSLHMCGIIHKCDRTCVLFERCPHCQTSMS